MFFIFLFPNYIIGIILYFSRWKEDSFWCSHARIFSLHDRVPPLLPLLLLSSLSRIWMI